jgi:DNA-binding response OmpR family regulator
MITMPGNRKPRILIVDDDVDTIRLICGILDGAGDLFFATDGEASLSLAREMQPDVVLLDAEMPGMNGYEVCKALKADATTASAEVIFVTAHSDIAHDKRALEANADDIINKPISPPVMRLRVRTHLTLKAQAETLRRLLPAASSESGS